MTELVANDLPAAADRSVPAVALPLASASTIEEFERVYHACFRDLSGYCSALLGDEELGVDCAQEAFSRLFGRFRTVRDPRSWLFLVATNLVRDEWRSRSRHRRAVIALAMRSPEVVDAPDDGLLDTVRRLPAPLSEVVMLHYFADLSVEDVARLVRRPVGTVKRRLHEARALLQKAIGDQR